MNRILFFCALGALWGCRTVTEPTTEVITLSYSTSEGSKTDALTAGDEVAVFARLDGTEHYFLEAEKFITGSDGHSLTYGSTVYYPETKQAVHFYAYFPYHTGSFSVPSDQSTAAALKQADLCWANASSTPVATPVPLTFQHLFARLIVHTNEPTSKIACLVVPSGVLNAATAQFTLTGGKREVFTTGNELILPVQPLTRLVLTVANIEYVFEGSINLQAGQTTTINLTLNTTTKTATLNGSSTTKWNASSQSGGITEAVSNILTLYWPNYISQGASPDKIIMTIGGVDYTVSNGITYADKTFVFPFASNQLRYPYTITKIAFYSGSTQVGPLCTQLLGGTIYKSMEVSVGVKDIVNQTFAVRIGSLWWATGNLVAAGSRGSAGLGGCKIGTPSDCGLCFQFGSLIGWKGANITNNGNGQGTRISPEGAFWNGNPSYSWANESYVWPIEMVGAPQSAWPSDNGTLAGDRINLNSFYFNYNKEPYSTSLKQIGDFDGLPGNGTGNLRTGRYAAQGVGDPCRYYLGGDWRVPSSEDYVNLFGVVASTTPYANIPNMFYGTTPLVGMYYIGEQLYFSAQGLVSEDGRINYYAGYYLTSSIADASSFYMMAFTSTYAHNRYASMRSVAHSVRCVSN